MSIVTPKTDIYGLLEECLDLMSRISILNEQVQDLKERTYQALRELGELD